MARKVSFGSHSDAGAKTRETLMTVLKTLKLRSENNFRTAFTNFLNQDAENSSIDAFKSLFDSDCDSTCN
jgi:hypothetical protein